MMTDGQALLLWLLVPALIAAVAGAIGGALVLWARTRWPQVLLQGVGGRYAIPVDVELQAQGVRLPVRVEQPEPVLVEVVTSGGPTQRELAARVIAAFPTIGPTDLGTIIGSSKSTAHAILKDAREGRLALPDAPEPEEGEL